VLDRVRPGASLHLETDILAKYVARMVGRPKGSAIAELFAGGGSGAQD
jgi:riboflavin synthase alpha subunit